MSALRVRPSLTPEAMFGLDGRASVRGLDTRSASAFRNVSQGEPKENES